jgi:hypothetical protein
VIDPRQQPVKLSQFLGVKLPSRIALEQFVQPDLSGGRQQAVGQCLQFALAQSDENLWIGIHFSALIDLEKTSKPSRAAC